MGFQFLFQGQILFCKEYKYIDIFRMVDHWVSDIVSEVNLKKRFGLEKGAKSSRSQGR
ncbi:MAG: hypothetical protein ACI81W_002914 [Saprospiraceae bacterium]|jgi:hypothetical protein